MRKHGQSRSKGDRADGRAITWAAQPVYVKVPGKVGRVLVRKVACPTCGAEVGAPCVSAKSNQMSVAHIARRRIAIREGFF